LQDLVILRAAGLQKPPDKVYNERDQNAEKDHGSEGKVKAEVLFLYPDITRQSANPMHFIVKEIHQQAYGNDKQAENNDVFAGVLIHGRSFTLQVAKVRGTR
jgi:hypothetical protein